MIIDCQEASIDLLLRDSRIGGVKTALDKLMCLIIVEASNEDLKLQAHSLAGAK